MLKTLWYFEKITKNSQNFGQKGAKKEENPFFIFRPPFFAEKRKIEKKRKTKIFRFVATHISKSPKSIGTTNLMTWMIVCIFFVFFALIEYGVILFCRFMLEYKEFPKEFGRKQLMRLDLSCLLISVISFIVFTIIYFPL